MNTALRLATAGFVLAASATSVAQTPPAITRDPTNLSVSLGATATFRAYTTGTSPFSYQWYRTNASTTFALDGGVNPSALTSLLNLTNVQSSDAGGYYLVVTNDWGSATSQVATLTVDPTFTKITTGPLVEYVGTTQSGAWGDYDADGYPDLFIAHFHSVPGALYHNNGDGTFTSITDVPFATSDAWISGAWVDLDNDGRLDLVTIRYLSGPAIVYFNNGDGTFSQVQLAEAGPCHVMVLDLNGDGLLDAVLAGSANWWAPAPSWFYRNNGDHTFTRLTSADIGPIANATTISAACADYDDDGSVDVFYGNYTADLFHNDGTGHFALATRLPGATATCAGAWGDYDNDGRLDFCAAGEVGASTLVFRNLGGGSFAATMTIPQSHDMSACWADYDNDGFLDFFLASDEGGQNALYHNNGNGTFTRITTGSIANDLPPGRVSNDGLWFDYDNDGFLDLYVFNQEANGAATAVNLLYHNNGNTNAWLKVRLIGTASNRDAVGAKVRVQATYAGQPRWQRRDITGGDSFSGNQLYAHFGLGNATNVDVLRIEWPSGMVQELHDVAVRQFLTVTEPTRLAMAQPGQLHIQCWKGMTYRLESSPDLATWTPLATVTNSNVTGGVQWTDPSGPSPRACFYRAVEQ